MCPCIPPWSRGRKSENPWFVKSSEQLKMTPNDKLCFCEYTGTHKYNRTPKHCKEKKKDTFLRCIFTLKKRITYFYSMCTGVHLLYVCVRGQVIWSWSYGQLWAAVWALGSEPWSSEEQQCSLTISPALHFTFFLWQRENSVCLCICEYPCSPEEDPLELKRQVFNRSSGKTRRTYVGSFLHQLDSSSDYQRRYHNQENTSIGLVYMQTCGTFSWLMRVTQFNVGSTTPVLAEWNKKAG